MASPQKPVEDINITTKRTTAERILDILNQPGIPVLHQISHARGVAESHLFDMSRYPTSSEGVQVENDFIRRVLEVLGPRDRQLSPEQQKAVLTETRELVEASIEDSHSNDASEADS